MTAPVLSSDSARVALFRLRNLHTPMSWQSGAFGHLTLCRDCLHRYPCPTIRIIGEQP